MVENAKKPGYYNVTNAQWCHDLETISVLLAVLSGIHRQAYNNAEPSYFLSCYTEQAAEPTVESSVIYNTTTLMWQLHKGRRPL